jgi:hypothetical protein
MEPMRQLNIHPRGSVHIFAFARGGGGECNKLDLKVGKAILHTHILVLVDSVMKGGVRSVRSKNPYFALIHSNKEEMLLHTCFFLLSSLVLLSAHGLG